MAPPAFTPPSLAPPSAPAAVDRTKPVLSGIRVTALKRAAKVRFSLSEPATVTLLVNGAPVVKIEPAGTFTVPLPKAGVATVSAQARDAAGNVGATVSG